MKDFKKLPFLLAKKANIDIVPIGISGMWRFSQGKKFIKYPKPLQLTFGKLITAEQIKNMTVDELVNESQKRVKELIFIK